MLVLILLIQSERLKWRVTAKTFLKEAAMVRQCKAKKLKNQSLENFKKQCPPQKKKKKNRGKYTRYRGCFTTSL